MSIIIHKLYGVDPNLESKLKMLGIKDNEDLLRACSSHGAMMEMARSADVDISIVRRLIHRAELARIRGIGETYTMLLEEAGVATAHDLAGSSPEDLKARLNSINAEKQLVGRVPALAMINGWVNKAQKLTISHN